jgi:hypothetical protein
VIIGVFIGFPQATARLRERQRSRPSGPQSGSPPPQPPAGAPTGSAFAPLGAPAAPYSPTVQSSPSPPLGARMDRFCPACGTENPAAGAFCSQCGKPLPPAS